MPQETQPKYLSTAQASRETGFSVPWFERSRWDGSGPPYIKVGRAVRYPVDDLHVWMRQRLRTSTTDAPVSIERPA